MTYLLSPHDDDSVLFAAFTCLRERPTVIVVADSYVQPARGESGCSAEERAAETARAHEILGCEIVRLGLRDDALTLDAVLSALKTLLDAANLYPETVYVPALEGGHQQHDLVTHAAVATFGTSKLRCYSTYARRNGVVDLQPTGTEEVLPTDEEMALKVKALQCYDSQIRINWPHFAAVLGRSEWLSPCCEAVAC